MSDEFGKILVVQQKMIGDVLTSTILLEALRKKYPKSELHYLVNSHTVPVVENNPFIDKLVLFTPEMEKSKFVFYRFLKQIREKKYDVVIDVYGKLSSVLITWFSKAKKRISYHKKHTAFVYTDTLKRLKEPVRKAGLAIENRMRLLEPLEIDFSYFAPKIYLSSEETQASGQFLEASGLNLERPVFMIAVLGSGPQKTYPSEYMAQLIDQIAEIKPQAQLLFNYIPSQKEEAQFIFEHCKKVTQEKIHFAVFADSLRKFMALTHHCDALIGNEGGAVNMAKALDVSTFMIFCPFISKQNWFGELEKPKNQAVHLSDFIAMTENDRNRAKKNPTPFYLRLKPELIYPKLKLFLNNLDFS
ncbi:MAG TPA: glycosyltransferase family 9 protein [Flavobacteriaceae bacterium]|nr:glycosyltransferase family 9 protein [Flavobacteriaceae bacterium]